jgi:hypothetical protein
LGRGALRVVVASLIAVAAVFAIDVGVFRTGVYRSVLDPASTAGSFEWRIRETGERARDPASDVLALGDSRVLEALSATVASKNAGGLRFINAAVPGTNPRCWFYFLRGADPERQRFRYVVIPLDTYNDDDGSLGAEDAAAHASDINYVIFRLGVRDVVPFALSFDYQPARQAAYEAGVLHALALKRDFQAFAADPLARLRELADYARAPHETSEDYPGLDGSLAGLAIDVNGNVVGMGAVPPPERAPFLRRLLHVPRYSPSYAAYRRLWLGNILERYRGTATRVVFVRIPALPIVVRRRADEAHIGVVRELATQYHALLLPPELFSNLEQPKYFADHDHLNADGRRIFSTTLGERLAAER